MKKIFIDGSAGTTGLRIRERLAKRTDIELITLSEEKRKDVKARRDALNNSDIAFLCLPDDAAREAVSMIENPNTAIIDTSTAHRTLDTWTYGFPELEGMREKIRFSKRIANPGCHASGFVALVAPLVKAGIIPSNTPLCAYSITGYSGGGKKMISEYENENRPLEFSSPRPYALTQEHKHLKEIVKICSLEKEPVFSPIVSDFYSGMQTSVALHREQINAGREEIEKIYKEIYNTPIVFYTDSADDGGFLASSKLSKLDSMQISVHGNDKRIMLTATFDNLGKGASGAAVQNMNILLGCEETLGLEL